MIDIKDRVHFYSVNDKSAVVYFDRMKELIDNDEAFVHCNSLVDAMELWHCKLYVEHGILSNFNSFLFLDSQKILSSITSHIVGYFKAVNVNKFYEEFDTLDFDYQKSVFSALDKLKLEFLTDQMIVELVEKFPYQLQNILKCPHLVKRHSVVLRDFLKVNVDTAELLLMQYVVRHDDSYEDLHFPKNFSHQDMEQCLVEYLDSPNVNYNYVKLLVDSKDDKEFKLSSEVRLKAREVYTRLSSEIFSSKDVSRSQFKLEVVVEDMKNGKPIHFSETTDDGHPGISTHFDRKYISNCSDVDMIYNFIFGCEWCNNEGYSNLISNPRYSSFFENFGLCAKTSYSANVVFKMLNHSAVLQVVAYQAILSKNGRSLETALKKYYECYLRDTYGYPAPEIVDASVVPAASIKIRALLPELEAIAKHYQSYATTGNINLKLIPLEKPMRITNVHSLLEIRNVYLSSDSVCEVHRITYDLFSDQSMLYYVGPFKKSCYSSLYELLISETVAYSMYEPYHLPEIDYLLDVDILKLDLNGYLRFSDDNTIQILSNLWNYQVISYWNYSLEFRKVIDQYIRLEWFEYDGFLLSKQEQRWFNYYLNDSEFSNGPSIRNNFLHGCSSGMTESEIQMDYAVVLILFIVFLFKIELDMSLAMKCISDS